MKLHIPKILLFGVLLILLSLICKVIVFNRMLLVLNVCLGPSIKFNGEQGHLHLAESPASREQVIFLLPTCLCNCWCVTHCSVQTCREIPIPVAPLRHATCQFGPENKLARYGRYMSQEPLGSSSPGCTRTKWLYSLLRS